MFKRLTKFRDVPYFRRMLIINERLQFGIVAYCLLFGTIINMEVIVSQLFLAQRVDKIDMTHFPILVPMVFLITFIIAIIAGFFVSNRIAGPIYRLKRHMIDLIDGKKCSELTFRKKDYFTEIIPVYNELLKKYNLTDRAVDSE